MVEIVIFETKQLSGVEKFSLQQMRFMLGWGPKSKLDDGLEA